VSPRERALLQAAKARLDALDFYPRRVRLRHVRVVTAPWLFRLPWLRRFEGYATWWVVFVRAPLNEVSEDLVTHELCHVWQMQHHPLWMPLSYLVRGYAANPYELEARRAAASWPGQASTGTRG
jgi:hypothetical protein